MEPGNVKVVCVRNQLDPLGSREIRDLASGRPFFDYVKEFYPFAPDDFDVAVNLNGLPIESVDQNGLVLKDGDILAFTAVPHGGGDGKNPLAMVLQLALIIAVAYYAPVIGAKLAGKFLTEEVATAIVSGVMMTAGGMLINALCPPPTFEGMPQGVANSPTYSWDVEPNRLGEGLPVPVIYGEHRITPPLIARHVETCENKQYLNLLYLIADHYVDEIKDIEINNTPEDYFEGVDVITRPGDVKQEVVQFFGDTRSDVPVRIKLSSEWVTRRTVGNGVQGFGVGIYCPNGLGYYTDQGGVDPLCVQVEMQYRRVGDQEWTTLEDVNLVPVSVPAYRWSAGYYGFQMGRRQWIEVEAGSEDPDEHNEGEPYTGPVEKWEYSNAAGARRVAMEWRWIQDGETVLQPGELRKPYLELSGNSRDSIRRMVWKDRFETPGQFDIRVRFYSEPPGGSMRHVNDTYFETIQEIAYDDFTYPGSALLAVRALAADQLSGGMPRLTCVVNRKHVPVEMDGTIVMKPANNPAWAAYDALRDDNYGGGVKADRIVLADFESWADYCEEKGHEVNLYLDSSADLQRTLNTISVLGRGVVVQMGSRFTCLVDRPSTPVQRFLFTMANIVKDSFQTEILNVDERADCVEVTYFDRDMNYGRQTVFVPGDSYGLADMPVNKTQITLPGEISRKRAGMYGKFLLNQNRYLTEIASWEADIDSLACLPGDVVDVQHDVPLWGEGGLLESVGPDWVELSRPVILQPGERYCLSIKFSDDARAEYELNPVTVETTTRTLYVGDFGAQAPVAGDLFSFGPIERAYKKMRVMSITRGKEGRRRIRAIEYIPEIYADYFDDENYQVEKPGPRIESLALKEIWITGPDGSGRSAVEVSWRGFAVLWSVFIRPSGGSWRKVGETREGRYLVEGDLVVGRTYDVAVTPSRIPMEGVQGSVIIQGKLAPPSDVTGFHAYNNGDVVHFRWNHIPDVDMWGYEIRQGATWNTARTIVNRVQENKAAWMPPVSGTYNFLIKAVDESGIYSVNAPETIVTIKVSTPVNVVKEVEETDQVNAEQGTYVNMVYLPGSNEIAWTPGLTDTDFPADFTDLGIEEYTGDRANGAYTSQVYDIGADADFILRLASSADAVAGDMTDVDLTDLTDQDLKRATDVELHMTPENPVEYRVSDNGTDWSGWSLFESPATLNARYWQHKASPSFRYGVGRLAIQSLKAVADLPDKEVRRHDVAISNLGTNFALSDLGFLNLLNYYVGVTVLGGAPLKAAVDKSNNNFTVKLFNQAGESVSGSVDLLIRGC